MEDYHELQRNPPGKRCGAWYRKISVEPVMFLYMGSYMLSSVVEQAFFVHKACMVDVGLPYSICNNISSKGNEEYNKKVQVVVSTFHQWESIASHAVPVVLAFYLGAWSDRRGRKLTLLLGLAGSWYYWLALLIISLKDDWPLQTVLYSATFPAALTGSSLAIFMSAISYVCDITSPEERTIRVTLLEVAYLLTMPVGVAVGSYLFRDVFAQSFPIMFSVSLSMMTVAIVYALLRLEWCTSQVKHTTPISCLGTVRDTVLVVTRSRDHHYRLYLWLIILAMAAYTFQRDEKNMTYLYTQLKFNWDVKMYSKFRTFQSVLFILGLLVGAPVIGRLFRLRDTVIVMLGAVSHTIARSIYATTSTPFGFYVGAGIGSLGPVAAPVLRSVVSKLVPASERGKTFSLLSVADTSVPILSGTLYSQVYNHTINTAPATIFWITVASQLFVLSCTLIIHCLQGSKPLEQAVDADTETKSVAEADDTSDVKHS